MVCSCDFALVAMSDRTIGNVAVCPTEIRMQTTNSKGDVLAVSKMSNRPSRAKPSVVKSEALAINQVRLRNLAISGARANPLGIPIAVARPR